MIKQQIQTKKIYCNINNKYSDWKIKKKMITKAISNYIKNCIEHKEGQIIIAEEVLKDLKNE